MILPCGCCDHSARVPAAVTVYDWHWWCRDCGAKGEWPSLDVLTGYAHPIERWTPPARGVPCMHEARYRGLVDALPVAELDATQRAILEAMSPEGQTVLLRVLRLLRRTRSQRPNRPT